MTEQQVKGRQQQQQEEGGGGNGDTDEEKALRESLATLDVQKKSMELEADAIVSELTTPPSEGVEPMGVDTPLVDKEGYPRGDIDVYRARTLRQRFHTLKTDHKAISQKLDAMLQHLTMLKNPLLKKRHNDEKAARTSKKPKPKFDPITGKWVVMNWDGSVAGVPGGEKRNFRNLSKQVSNLTEDDSSFGTSSLTSSMRELSAAANPPTAHITATANNAAPMANSAQAPPQAAEPPAEPAFARVNAVAEDSPAEAAGLLEEDLIFQFGPLNSENHNHLKAIAALVPDVAGKQGSISISVRRKKPHSDDWKTVVLPLTPRPWSGRGLIGCHIVPYTS
ncbi:MAG: hypothetical protein SGBAC_012475 [Bacillariaceae sp.]